MQAKTIKGQSPTELISALENCMIDGFSPTLAIVFLSIHMDREAICKLLHDSGLEIIGATSSGEFIDGHQSKGEAVIMLMDISRDHYSIILEKTAGRHLDDVIERTAEEVVKKIDDPAFITLTSCVNREGGMFEGTRLVELLEQSFSNQTDIFGGMAGADGEIVPSWVFTHSKSTDEGFALLVLDKNKIELAGVAISGWKPLGRIRMVTRCEDGWLYTIDDQPALDMYLRYLGESMDQLQEDSSFVDSISLFHPFIYLDNVDPELRTPMFVDKGKNAIMLDFPIPEGGKFQFTMPPDFDIVESVLKEAQVMQKDKNMEADALLVFSCLGRLNALGPMATMENEGLNEIWKAPMAGFFTYGEYGKDPEGKNKMHSTTCSWVSLKEK